MHTSVCTMVVVRVVGGWGGQWDGEEVEKLPRRRSNPIRGRFPHLHLFVFAGGEKEKRTDSRSWLGEANEGER